MSGGVYRRNLASVAHPLRTRSICPKIRSWKIPKKAYWQTVCYGPSIPMCDRSSALLLLCWRAANKQNPDLPPPHLITFWHVKLHRHEKPCLPPTHVIWPVWPGPPYNKFRTEVLGCSLESIGLGGVKFYLIKWDLLPSKSNLVPVGVSFQCCNSWGTFLV